MDFFGEVSTGVSSAGGSSTGGIGSLVFVGSGVGVGSLVGVGVGSFVGVGVGSLVGVGVGSGVGSAGTLPSHPESTVFSTTG